MEKKIKALLEKKGLTRVKLDYLVDLGNTLDNDLEELPIVADVVEIRDGDVYIYDEFDEGDNGVIDPIFKVSDLKDYEYDVLGDLWWILNKTLGTILRYTIVNVINDYDLLREEIEPYPWCLNYIEDTSLNGDGVSFDTLDTNQAEVERYLKQNNIQYVKVVLKS